MGCVEWDPVRQAARESANDEARRVAEQQIAESTETRRPLSVLAAEVQLNDVLVHKGELLEVHSRRVEGGRVKLYGRIDGGGPSLRSFAASQSVVVLRLVEASDVA